MLDTQDQSKQTFFARVHDMFYTLSFTYRLPESYRAIVWVLEKALLLAPLLLLTFHKTSWEEVNTAVVNLNVLKHFLSDGTSFSVFCYALLAGFHAFVVLLALKLIFRESTPAFIEWPLAVGFHLVSSIYTVMASVVTFYLIIRYWENRSFAEYKQISVGLVVPYSATHIGLTVGFIFTMCECVTVDLFYLLLYQDHQLTLFCSTTWRRKALDLVSKVGIMAVFVLDGKDDYILVSGLCVAGIFLLKVVSGFWTPLVNEHLHDFSDLFYDCCFLMLSLLIVLCSMTSSITFAEYYQYTAIIPIYALAFCLIRVFVQSGVGSIKTEEEAMHYLRTLVRLCKSHDDASLVTLVGILEVHKETCARPGCLCGELMISGGITETQRAAMLSNEKAYETGKMLPDKVIGSWRLKAFTTLIGEISPQLSKSYDLSLALAEISFYYFANYYQALNYVESVELQKQSLICNQYTTNIRNVIEAGMWNDQDDAVELLQALRFQKKYSQFLGIIDDSCEFTVKFWTLLLEDKPDPVTVMKLGRELYENRYKLQQLVNEVSKINSGHTEFLVRYGLYAKYIMDDRAAAANVYQRILWINDNLNSCLFTAKDKFSLFRGDCQVMMLVASLEQSNFFVITEVNNAIEYQLGYSREDLLRFSVTKLMPFYVAKQHHAFVQKFFQTMQSRTVREESLKFLKHQEGYLVPCVVTKKILPDLGQGLQGVMLFYADPSMQKLEIGKSDRTRKKVTRADKGGQIGALICDSKEKILDVTKEVYDYLFFNKETIQTVKNNVTVSSLFPEMGDEAIRTRMKRPQGAIIGYCPEITDLELDGGEFGEKLEEEPRKLGSPASARKKMLLWVKTVTEKCGDEVMTLVLFSPILEKFAGDYAPLKQYKDRVYEKLRVEDALILGHRKEGKNHPSRAKEEAAAKLSEGGDTEPSCDMRSVEASSMASIDTSTRSKSATTQMDLFSQELQVTVSSKETQPVVKRLNVVLLLFFAVVLTLTGVESAKFYAEIDDLKERFQMIEFAQIRNELVVYLAISPRSYDTYRRAGSASTFVSYCYRTRVRADRTFKYHLKVRLAFNKFGLGYDYDDLTITYGDESYLVSFDYALLKYLNEVNIFTQLNDYAQANACITDLAKPLCKENALALQFCGDNGLYSLRLQAERTTRTLMRDLKSKASSGRDMLYTLISVCIGIVALSSAIIFVFLVQVIKDKSYVMAIFAELKKEEIEQVIADAKSLPITTVRFRGKDVSRSAGDETKYWKTLARHYKVKDSKKEAVAQKSQAQQHGSDIASKYKIGADSEPRPASKAEEKKEAKKEEKSEDPDDKEKEKALNDTVLAMQMDEERKRESKRELLSQIEY